MQKNKVSDADLMFVSTLSQAALEKPMARSKWLLWSVGGIILWFLVWASFAEVDKIVRGEGKVVPSSNVQVMQNLEGGIVESILIKPGQVVKKGQVLIQLDNTLFASSFEEQLSQEGNLKAQVARLTAEAFNKPFEVSKEKFAEKTLYLLPLYEREKSLFDSRKTQLATTKAILDQKIKQSRLEYQQTANQIQNLKETYSLLKKEISLMQPLVRKGVASELDLLKMQREASESLSKIKGAQNTLPNLASQIEENRSKKTEAEQRFQIEAEKELNAALAQLEQIQSTQIALADRVKRTSISSPVDGTVSELFVTSLGEVVQPGSDLVKIVPLNDQLVMETKIAPKDIGFLYPGLKAKVKFTAYDFSIYGGLDGQLVTLSADSVQDEERNSFYVARITTEKNHLGSDEKPLILLPGMLASVDIIVGQQTVMTYLTKPIFKTQQSALTEP